MALCVIISVHEITLSHWQHFYGFAGQKPAIGPHFIGFWVNLHTGCSAIQNHGTLPDLARVLDGEKLLCESKPLTLRQRGLADECNRAFRQRAAERTEHWPIIFRLRGRNGSVRVSHDRGGDRAAFQHHVGFHAEKRRLPDTEIGKLSDFNRADVTGNALSYR